MTDKLSLYNQALGHLVERKLKSLTEAREPRRVLDDFWDPCVAYCLERKSWNFAFRAQLIDKSASVVPSFGFSNAFLIPDDWVRTHLMSSSETLSPPLLQVREEAGYWYCDVDPLYVQYVSNDPAYGMDLSRWPSSYADYVALDLAKRACKRVTGSSELLRGPEGLIKQSERASRVAAGNCAMNDPVGFAPTGSWVRSRWSGFRTGGDNPGGSLIG